jgi:HD-GYP domain-containing protein (c-di-GMP phosphodiesterase class II)
LVIDRTITGQRIRQAFEATNLSRSVAYDWIDSGTADDVARRAAAVPKDDILVYVVYFNPQDGYQSNSRILERVRAVARVPVYAFWAFNLAAGAFGGYLYDGTAMGQVAAQMVKEIQAGQGFRFFDQTLASWIFDWPQAQSFGMADSSFPLGTELVHRPPDFWAINRTAAIVFVLVFLALLGYTFLIGLHLRSQKTVRHQNEQIISTQRELMHSLGNVIENRSNETASHVQRITVLSLFLADLIQLPDLERRQLELCAPMHDIGKVGIPDEILKKPGILTPEEFEIMKTHTTLGHSIFKASSNPMIQAAAKIALDHHERWDGKGYPSGKAREEIDLLARIVSVVDVADALLSDRSYKSAWPSAQVKDFLTENSGQMFDPRLCQKLLDHWEEFVERWQTAAETVSQSQRPSDFHR